MATRSKQKKVKGVRQKLKIFRANEPLKSVLMWGVNYSFSQLEHVKTRAMLLTDDFKAYVKVKGNNHLFNKDSMPSHFKFKEYCPLVFQNIRKRFNVDENVFLESFIKKQPSWCSHQGRSGSKFLLTYNKHFLVKTISREEVEQMHNMLQNYHEYIVNRYAATLLPQYLAMYRVTVNDQETYLLVMRFVFSPRLPIHRKYDLKGSTVDREATEKEKRKSKVPTLKDVDFVNDSCKILIGEEEKERVVQLLETDTQFLQENHLMDYSLIVGIHDPNVTEDVGSGGEEVMSPEEDEDDGEREDSGPETGPVGADRRQSALSLEGGPANFTPPDSPDCIAMDFDPFKGEFDPNTEYYAIKSTPRADQPLIYFLALTDILTRYGVRKRTAQTYKTVKHGASAEISTVKPDVYARRFLDFINQTIE